MIPTLFKIGPFEVHSYGLCLALGFMTGYFLLIMELRRRHIPEEKAASIIFWAMLLGVVGSKIPEIYYNWADFQRAPFATLFSRTGLTWHGGLILAGVGLILMFRHWKIPIPVMCDAVAPMLATGYGWGRIGCQLAGDGDYGTPSDLPWAMAYPNGVVPTLQRVHPTPIYEALAMLAIFAILWRLRKNPQRAGWLFSLYLILAGVERLLVEFIRINPKILLGLTEAQVVAVVMIAGGAVGLWRTWRKDYRIEQ
jgi:phosphatidylglycerol:prolipoprotein diacylglycerol transferase